VRIGRKNGSCPRQDASSSMAAAVQSVLPALWKLPARGVASLAWTLQAGRTWMARTVSKQSVVTPRTMVSLPTELAAGAVADSGPPRPSPIMLRRQCFMQPRSLVSQFRGLPSTTPSTRTASSWSTAWPSMVMLVYVVLPWLCHVLFVLPAVSCS